ncbi:MAG: PAS domain S-box protein [Nitrospinales bacterium]
METAEQYNQEPSSIRKYFYALIIIVLIVIAGTASFLFWVDFQSQKTIQTSNKFHLAVITHTNNIKHDIQQLESFLVHRELPDHTTSTKKKIFTSPEVGSHLYRIKENIDELFSLKEKFGVDIEESISDRLRVSYNQLNSSIVGQGQGGRSDVAKVRAIFRSMRITLLQLESLHLTINSENLEIYRNQKGETIRNFLALVVAILIIGLIATFRALARVNQMLKERVEDRLSLKKTNLFLSSILESSSKISIVATDLNGIITYWNKGAQEMFEYTSDEVVGKQSVDILYPDSTETKDITRKASSKILDNENNSFSCEVQEKTKSGKLIWVNLEISKRFSSDNKLEGILGIGVASQKN